jgi:hypothetical protein
MAAHYLVLPLGEEIVFNKKFFTGIVPSSAYEITYSTDDYYMVVVIYANKEKILGFPRIYREIADIYKDRVIPAFYCVDTGCVTSWFAVFIKKEE